MPKSIEQTITELADREAIRELPQRYCDCVWQGDVEGIVKLFADDGEFTVATTRGHEQGPRRTAKDLQGLKTYKAGLANLTLSIPTCKV